MLCKERRVRSARAEGSDNTCFDLAKAPEDTTCAHEYNTRLLDRSLGKEQDPVLHTLRPCNTDQKYDN